MILVDGSKGFLGKNLVDRLDGKYDFTTYNRGDRLDTTGVNTVIHLACDGDARGSNVNLVRHTNNNIGIFMKVLQSAIRSGVSRFIYISSAGVTWEKSVYAIQKLTCEEMLKLTASLYGFKYVIIRPHNMFGKHMKLGDKNRNVIANFISKKLSGEPVEIIGNVKSTRQFTYVGQVVDVIEQSLSKNTNEIITVSSGIETSVEDLDYMITNLVKTIKWANS
jgi:nucleoside-diphosphate-sugar epimerase